MKKILIALLFALPLFAHAESQCAHLYPFGKVINVPNTIELCNQEFVAVYDPVLKGNIFSAEKYNSLYAHAPRINAFHPDMRLSKRVRAEVSDYRNSGYDKGHMAPAADANTTDEMFECFSMANMTPQEPMLNEEAWKYWEEHVRATAKGQVYILTGAIYDKNPPRIGRNGIPVPSSYYKCSWYNRGAVECITAQNKPYAHTVPVSLQKVEEISGLKLH